MLVLALNFAITPFLAYPNAWLVREMRFGSIAAVRFIGALVHAASAITMAWLGYGPVSLAWANALTTVASIIAIWALPTQVSLAADCARHRRCGFVRGKAHCHLVDEYAVRRGTGTVAGENSQYGGCRFVQPRTGSGDDVPAAGHGCRQFGCIAIISPSSRANRRISAPRSWSRWN